jgi:hypothetical protein
MRIVPMAAVRTLGDATVADRGEVTTRSGDETACSDWLEGIVTTLTVVDCVVGVAFRGMGAGATTVVWPFNGDEDASRLSP